MPTGVAVDLGNTTGSTSSRAATAAPSGRLRREEILDQIIHIQREYVRDGDPQRMWDLLIESILAVSESAFGFIGEVVWGNQALPHLETRAIRCSNRSEGPPVPHPDIGLLVSQVIAEERPVFVEPRRSGTEPSPFSPESGFLGLPLESAHRMVAVVGLTGPTESYSQGLVDYLEPLLAACASIVESIQAARARDAAIQRLERTAGFLNAVIESTAHGILVINSSDGVVESANRAAHVMLDPPGGSVTGSLVHDLIGDADRSNVERLLRIARRRGLTSVLQTFETTIPRPGGDPLPVEATLSEFSIGGVRRLVALLHDVSDRRAAEWTSKRAMEVIEAAPDFIAWSDADGVIGYVNQGGRDLLGLSGESAGMRVTSLCAPWSEVRLVDEAIPSAILDGSWSGELTLIDLDGTEVPVWMVVMSGHTDDAEYLAFLARDLRERRQIELIKDAFISNVSHELRTPLTSILGYVELITDGSFGDVAPGLAEALGVIERNGDRLLDLIGQILRVSLLDHEAAEYTERVDLSRVVTSAVEGLAGCRSSHVTSVDVVPGVSVLGDQSELSTVISNLVGNAYKFTPEPGSVVVSLRRSGDWASLEVADTGYGIPAHELDTIFERFQRGEDARRREIQGTGLGLSIVQSIVRRHGGRISVTSQVGVGSSFRVMLPISTEEGR